MSASACHWWWRRRQLLLFGRSVGVPLCSRWRSFSRSNNSGSARAAAAAADANALPRATGSSPSSSSSPSFMTTAAARSPRPFVAFHPSSPTVPSTVNPAHPAHAAAITAMALTATVTLATLTAPLDDRACCEAERKDGAATKTGAAPGPFNEAPDGAHRPQLPPLPANPLHGLSDDDIDALVEEWLRDPVINITAIPDFIERQIYRNAIHLTLNAAYQSIASLHGCEILAGHCVILERVFGDNDGEDDSNGDSKEQQRRRLAMRLSSHKIADDILVDVADRLLSNEAINHTLIPDAVERQLYINCMKLIFRVLDLIASSFRLTVCGHDLYFSVEPADRVKIQEAALRRVASSSSASDLTRIDMAAVRALAREAGVQDDYFGDGPNTNFLTRLLRAPQREFMTRLNGSLYGLILGIVDDVLNNTEIEFLSDRIRLDLVAGTAAAPAGEEAEKAAGAPPSAGAARPVPPPPPPPRRAAATTAASFAVGVGVGVALMAMATSRR